MQRASLYRNAIKDLKWVYMNIVRSNKQKNKNSYKLSAYKKAKDNWKNVLSSQKYWLALNIDRVIFHMIVPIKVKDNQIC